MKNIVTLSLLAITTAAFTAGGEQIKNLAQPPKESYAPVPVVNAPGTPVVQAAPLATTGGGYVYRQQLFNDRVQLISADQGQAIVGEFRTNYPKLGSPRMLIYVNRELVDEKTGLKISKRTEKVTGSTGSTEGKDSNSTKSVVKNTYAENGKSEPTLADRQTVRDVERLMGRPLRSAGATLVDQRLASQLIANLPPGTLGTDTDQARKDREAAMRVADVVVEVLISSRSVTALEISGEKTYTVPDIQMTAMRLKDAKILGQATAADVMNKAGGAAAAARNFTVQDITETTTLALMDDIVQEMK